MDKIVAFEYVMWRLITQYCKKNPDISQEKALKSFDRIKAMKLLFFISAVEAENGNDGLLGTFDKFYAMPYGHVEGDIYDAIVGDKLKYYSIKKKDEGFVIKKEFENIDINKEFEKIDINEDFKNKVETAIQQLELKNEDILYKCQSFQLVDLSHEWYSWKLLYNPAKFENRKSFPIPPSKIKSEPKFYKLKLWELYN